VEFAGSLVFVAVLQLLLEFWRNSEMCANCIITHLFHANVFGTHPPLGVSLVLRSGSQFAAALVSVSSLELLTSMF
jgi:hypothetical protein